MLQPQTPPMPDFLEHLRIINAGPFNDFRLEFKDPVTTIAGPNGSGKTTILLAASSAHNPNHHAHAGLFDPLLPHRPSDQRDTAPRLEFTYAQRGRSRALTIVLWKSMSKAAPGDPTPRPMNPTYLSTLGHLSSIHDTRPPGEAQGIRAAHIANRILNRDYAQISIQPDGRHPEMSILHASGVRTNRYQMSYGEQEVARLAYDLTRLHGGLALLDQPETCLHPSVQKPLMDELTLLSAENGIQFIITTHSPELMAASPVGGRVFLEPTDHGDFRAVQRTD